MYSIGIEIETTSLPENLWRNSLAEDCGWRVETDGSIRTHKSRSFIPKRLIPQRENERFGAELVSPVIYVKEDMWDNVFPIMTLLQDSREVSRANQSVHIHVGRKGGHTGLYKHISYLKEVDKILYDVSAPTKPRGMFNDFIYYRPLVSPQWAWDGDYYLPSIGQVENCKNLSELKFCLGRKDLNPPKWYPARYCGINLVALFDHGTIEFRHFNFTNDFLTLKSWVYLCVGIVRSIYEKLFYTELNQLLELGADGMPFSELEKKEVYRNIDLSPIKTHTGRSISWERSVYTDHLVPKQRLSRVREVDNPHPEDVLDGEVFMPIIL